MGESAVFIRGVLEEFAYRGRPLWPFVPSARAVVVTPLSVSAPYWNKLLQAPVVPNEACYLRFRRQAVDVDSDIRGELALFAVDFTRYSTRAYLAKCLPPCGHERAFRGRPQAGSPADTAERARIHEELERVGLALRT